MRSRRSVLLAALLAAFACEVEDTSTIEVTVRVDAPAAAPSLPAQVLVAFDSSGSGDVVFLVGFVCAPDTPFSTTAVLTVPGDPPTVNALLVPVRGSPPSPCGPLATPRPVTLPRDAGASSRTTARLEVLGGCGSGDVRAATVVVGPQPR